MHEVVTRVLGVDNRAGKPENQCGDTEARDATQQPACDPANDRYSDTMVEMAPEQIAMVKPTHIPTTIRRQIRALNSQEPDPE
jgi:hypothetical protein